MRTTVNILLLLVGLTLLPLPASAGHLDPPEHCVGVVFGQSFAGVTVYEEETEFRLGNNWYRVQVPAARVERIATVCSSFLALLAATATG